MSAGFWNPAVWTQSGGSSSEKHQQWSPIHQPQRQMSWGRAHRDKVHRTEPSEEGHSPGAWKAVECAGGSRPQAVSQRGCTESCARSESSKGRALCSPFGGPRANPQCSRGFKTLQATTSTSSSHHHVLSLSLFPFLSLLLLPLRCPFCASAVDISWPAYRTFTLLLLWGGKYEFTDSHFAFEMG